MILPTPVKYRKRRYRKPRPIAPAATGLLVINATAVEAGGELEVTLTFNTSSADPLGGTSGADPQKWLARFNGQRYEGLAILPQTDETLLIQMSHIGANAGADEISYAGPSDISDTLGRELQPFSGMPLEGT